MNTEKKMSNTIIIVILMILVIGLSGYIIYDKVINSESNITEKDDKESEKEVEEEKVIVTEENALEVYKVLESKYALELPGSGYAYNYFSSLYDNKKVVVDDTFTEIDKLTMAYLELSEEDIERFINEDLSDYMHVSKDTFAIEKLSEKYYMLFGKNEEFEAKDFESYIAGDCTVVEDNYECWHAVGGGESDFTYMETKYKDFEYKKDELYIYEYAVFYEGFPGEDITYYKGISWDEESYSPILIDEIAEVNEDNLMSKDNLDKYAVYKHTFKIDKEGNYYLYSTEPVK